MGKELEKMMRCKFAWCVLVLFGMPASVCCANMYNKWAQENAVNINASASQNTADKNLSAPLLQRIKQESQTCGQVVVNLMQRPLNVDILGVARGATGGTAAHVQVVAIDKSTGKVVDNFGVTGDFGGGGQARIFSEKDLDKYDSKPCGTYEMSSDDYYAAKERTIKQIEGGAIYEPYSGVGLKNLAKAGAEAGAQVVAPVPVGPIASAAGAVAGTIGGAMAANNIYETRRHDYGIHSDNNAKMSFPIVNCQAGGDMFVKNLEGLPTVVPVEEYVQPGEKTAQRRLDRDNSNDKARHPDLEDQNLDDQSEKVAVNDEMLGSCKMTDVPVAEREKDSSLVGVRGWCHCWDKTPPYRGCLKKVGVATISDAAELANTMGDISRILEGFYSYTICTQCGKCYTTAKIGKEWSDLSNEIVDAGVFNKYKEIVGMDIPIHTFNNMLAKARDKLLVIPDGQIVISGVCRCKNPDPMRVGVRIPGGEYYICVFCGRVRLPDGGYSMPVGPTEWHRMMGNDKPFPGFQKQASKQNDHLSPKDSTGKK